MTNKSTKQPIHITLTKIRGKWLDRVGNDLAKGMEVKVGFVEQLDRFFNLLIQAITTNDPAWMDPVLLDWAKSSTESDLEENNYHVTYIINRMIPLTIQVAHENLSKQQMIDVLGQVVPIFTYGLGVVARYEMEARVAHISNEMDKIQKQMERVDKSKSAFISVAAHELKTPITLIEGYASMMEDMVREGQTIPINAMVNGMQTGIERLRAIVDDMLDISMLDNNLMQLNYQPIQLEKIIDGLKSELSSTVSERKIILEVKPFDGNKAWVYIDPARITQAVKNILNNAIKYTPDGGRITIDGRTLPGMIEITVADTGIGIAQENQSSIFEKFDQLGRVNLHSSGKTKFKGGGPGLGLPISRGIMEAHGGSIWVESDGYDEDELPGSTFHILIPIRTEAPPSSMSKLFHELDKDS